MKAAILGQQGGVWANSTGYDVSCVASRGGRLNDVPFSLLQLSTEEQANIIKTFDDPSTAQVC